MLCLSRAVNALGALGAIVQTRALPEAEAGMAARDTLRDGSVVAMATETVYGLFGDATNPDAVARIFAAKGRPHFNPLIAHVANREMADRIGVFGSAERSLSEAFWPGPLTLVVPRQPDGPVCDLACAGLDTIAIRSPVSALVTGLAQDLAVPLAGPSANRSGHVSATTADAVLADLRGHIPLVVDSGPTTVGLESTIVRIVDGRAMILRPGSITSHMIRDQTGLTVAQAEPDTSAPVAPGMLSSHYAPVAPVILNAMDAGRNDVFLAFGPVPDTVKGTVLLLSAKSDPVEAAARLYTALRAADSRSPETIRIAPIPDSGLGTAINDRLRRAAAPRP